MPGALTLAPRTGAAVSGRLPVAVPIHRAGFLAALLSGGDTRLAVDPLSGNNKYSCPPVLAPDLVSFASCTASPGSRSAASRRQRNATTRLAAPPRGSGVRRAWRSASGASRRPCCAITAPQAWRKPSCVRRVPDALLAAALLVAAERPDIPLTAIIPAAAETGTGVPLAAACRQFDGPAAGTLLAGCPATVLEIPLRSDDGVPLGEDAVNSAFAAAARSVRGRAVICLTHGSKTGLVAPTSVPAHADVIVDACQARIGPDAVAAYLRRGWPVVLTASKFFGGPAFAAALLLPRARVAAFRDWRMAPGGGTGTLGTVLRWTAALGAIEAFGRADGMADALLACGAAVSRGLGSIPSLEQVGGLRRGGQGWDGLPSIFTFGVRDPADRKRLLTMAGLQPLHRASSGTACCSASRSAWACLVACGSPSGRGISSMAVGFAGWTGRSVRWRKRRPRPCGARGPDGRDSPHGCRRPTAAGWWRSQRPPRRTSP